MDNNGHNRDHALIKLGGVLLESGYEFTAITPRSHETVLRRDQVGQSIRDLIGWNRATPASCLDSQLVDLLKEAGAVQADGALLRPQLRAATLAGQLYFHSAFPTLDADAVFFGPDTYRTVRWLRAKVQGATRLVDVGSGSGAVGLSLADRVAELCLADINPQALRLSQVNAAVAKVADRAEVIESNLLSAVAGEFDLVVSNPPYLIDEKERAYRHGGGRYGGHLSLRIVDESLERLPQGGRLVLYTASAIVDGRDTLYDELRPLLCQPGLESEYEEVDPDVFGEELEHGVYAKADRIAAVGLCVTKK